MSLKKLTKSLDDTKDAITSLTDKIIERSQVFQQIAASPLGGYLDKLTKILQDLHDPAKIADRVRLSQSLVAFQNLLRQMFPDFDVTQYENAFKAAQRPDASPSTRRTAQSPGGSSSSGMGMGGLSVKQKKAIIDILNDDAGAGATNWYKADDPDYLKILQSQGTMKGH